MNTRQEKRRSRLVQLLLSCILVFAVGMALTQFVVWILGVDSKYRFEHGLVAVLALIVISFLFRPRRKAWLFVLVGLFPCYFGSALPDLDITFLGIGGHRNPLFHSCLAYIPLALIFPRLRAPVAWAAAGFGIGLGSHLIWDTIDFGDVRWFPGTAFDKIWLLGNGIFAIAHPIARLWKQQRARRLRRRLKRQQLGEAF
ncbi:MAG: hypothetical protein ACI8UO_003181 [Verrucomicrobiales bacterium]|jgi:hypothetical protein